MKRPDRLRRAALLCGTAALLLGAGPALAADHPPYVPQPFTIPADAPYRLADGSVRIVGDATMAPVLERLNALFRRSHPEVRFSMLLREPPSGFDGVMAGVTLFGPIARDAWDTETEPYERLTGHRPLDVRVGRRGFVAPDGGRPPALYVHASNPIAGIAFADFGRLYTMGGAPGDLRYWRQLGATGEWEPHAIHIYATRDDGRETTALRMAHFGGRPMARQFEALPSDADVLRAVAGDRWSMGLAGAVAPGKLPPGVRLLPLAQPGGAPSAASRDDVRAGRYPLSPFLHFYLPNGAGQPLDPLAREYLRLALSREGQQVIEAHSAAPRYFVSLSPEEAAKERAKLD